MNPRAVISTSWRRALLAVLFLASCSDSTTGPEQPLTGRVSVRSVFAAGESASELRLTVDSIRVLLTRGAPAETVTDTRAAFFDGQALSWMLTLHAPTEPITARVELSGGGELLYIATATIAAAAGAGGQAEVHDIVVQYVGTPRAMSIALADAPIRLTARGATHDLAATALDRSGQPLSGKVVTWVSSDPAIATVDALGRVTARDDGTAQVTARLEGLERAVSVTVAVAADVARSTIDAAPASLPADGASAATVLVRLMDANDQPLDASGGIVALSTSLGALVGMTDHGDGTYTARLASATAGTATVTATLDGAALLDTATIEFTPLPPAPAAIEITPDAPSTLTALGTTQAFTALVRDQYGAAMTGIDVTWSSSAPGVASIDASSGLATAVANGTASVIATVGSIAATRDLSVMQEPSAAQSSVAASPVSLVADGNTTAGVVVSLRDARGNALDAGGHVVALATTLGTLTAVVDRGDGTYGATLTSTSAGHADVTATLGGSAIASSASVEFTPMPPVATSIVVTPASTTSLTALGATQSYAAIVRDQYGAVMGSVGLLWTSSATAVATIDPTSGLATATGDGATTITATVIGASAVHASATLLVAQLASPAHSTIAAAPQSLMADGTSAATVTVTMRDAHANPLRASAGTVALRTSHGALSAVTDRGDGTYTASLTATSAGSAIVRAALAGADIAGEATVEFTPLPPVATSMTLAPAAAPHITALGATQQLTATVIDQYGAPMAGVGLLWSSSAPTVVSVDATSGLATAVGNGTATVSATVIGANGVDASATLTVAQVASAAHSTFTAAPASVPADGMTPATVVVTARDARGHALSASAGTVVIGADLGSVSAVTDRADGTYSATVTSPTFGASTVHVTLDGTPIPGTATITFAKLPSVLASLELAPSAATLDAIGATQLYTAIARDQYGEPMAGVPLAWSVDAPSVVSIDAGTGLVTALANGSATVTATGAGAVTGHATATVAIVADPSRTTLTTSAVLLPADTVTAATITVRLFDGRGNALTHSGGTVALASSIGALSPVTDHGDGRYTATLASAAVGTARVSGAVDGVAFGAAADVEFFSIVPVLTSLEVTPAASALTALGDTHQFTALGRDQFGAPMAATLTWESLAGGIATIDAATGLATAVANGTVTIRASANGVSGSAPLTVAQVASATHATMSASPAAILADGTAATILSVTLRDARGNALTAGGETVTLHTDRGTLSSVTDHGDGRYTATLRGSSVGVATVGGAVDGAPMSATVAVELLPVLTSIVITPGSGSLAAIGATRQFTAVGLDATGVPMPGVAITWTSSDPTVAAVDALSGLAAAARDGVTTIRATSGGITGEITLTVAQVVTSVDVTAPVSTLRALGATATFGATASDALGAPVTGRTISWSTSDAAVASVDADGRVTAVGNGTAAITATIGTVSTSADITVQQRATTISLVASCDHGGTSCEDLDALGAHLDLTPTVLDSLGQPVASPAITWSSSDPNIVSVDADGRVTAVHNGAATITATIDGVSTRIGISVHQLVKGVRLPTEDIKIKGIGTTLQMTAVAIDRNGNAVLGAEITWAISDPHLATIDANGLITTHGVGSTKLTATAAGFTAKAIVTIS